MVDLCCHHLLRLVGQFDVKPDASIYIDIDETAGKFDIINNSVIYNYRKPLQITILLMLNLFSSTFKFFSNAIVTLTFV